MRFWTSVKWRTIAAGINQIPELLNTTLQSQIPVYPLKMFHHIPCLDWNLTYILVQQKPVCVFLAHCRLKNYCGTSMFSVCMCTSLYVYSHIRETERGVLSLSTFESIYLLSRNVVLMLCNWRSYQHRALWFSAVDTHSIANTKGWGERSINVASYSLMNVLYDASQQ